MQYNRLVPYNTDLQIWAVKARFAQFKVIKRGRYNIEFIGDLKVKDSSPIYTVSVIYRGAIYPEVKIIKPELIEHPPHFFKQSKTLCLYHPKNYKWSKERLIAVDILPWVAAWIYFYEIWLKKKIWYGPEVDHNDLSLLETN